MASNLAKAEHKHVSQLLRSQHAEDSELAADLRIRADHLLSSTESNPSPLPLTLHKLLTEIIKPLFATSQHPSITSTGRKNLLPKPTIPNRFSNDPVFDPPPPWKNAWTVPLLSWIVRSYNVIPEVNQMKTVEEHFHLLVPPLLNLIDDVDIAFKANGCVCLEMLCTVLYQVQSDLLKRTGLADVFIDALKNCFHLLPTLTPAEDSLYLLRSLYPAYLALVQARFVTLELSTRPVITTTISSATAISAASEVKSPEKSMKAQAQARSDQNSNVSDSNNKNKQLSTSEVSTETDLRTKNLSLLLRHSLLHSLAHLSSHDGSIASTTSPYLTTFLLRQIGPVLRPMHAYAAIHLQAIIPLLVDILHDPFSTAVTVPLELLEATVEALEKTVQICWERIRKRWWIECLYGCVDGYLNVKNEYSTITERGQKKTSAETRNTVQTEAESYYKRKEGLQEAMSRLKMLVVLLKDVVGPDEFNEVVKRLVEEEGELSSLFEEFLVPDELNAD